MQKENKTNLDPNNGWSNDIENVLESIRQNSVLMSEYHKKNYVYYNAQLKYYKIPIIIISGLNSVTAVGLQPYIAQQHISVTNCLLALLCGIIGSIELFLGISAGSETELKASKDFYILSIDIYMTLTLDRQRRPPAKTFLDHKFSEYSDLFKGSALINSKKVVDKLSSIQLTCANREIPFEPTNVPISIELPLPEISTRIPTSVELPLPEIPSRITEAINNAPTSVELPDDYDRIMEAIDNSIGGNQIENV